MPHAAENALALLAIQMQARAGAYALLLGSGISLPANIPNGWGVTMHLVRRLAAGQVQPDADDTSLEAWYRENYGEAPSYSTLIQTLTLTAAQERDLLAGYFEPNPERPDERQPTVAHKAIAQLMAKGIVKIVLTTNFDRLLEQALAAVGVTPDVLITSEDEIASVVPRVHAYVVIVKVHGDYKRVNLRNSPERLSGYPDVLTTYLTEIRRDYGLVIAGWSGGYDPALREIVAAPSAYPTYWIEPGEPHETTNAMRAARAMPHIQLDADTAFDKLLLKIEALERVAPPMHAPDEAAKIVKRLLSDPGRYRIQLEDYLQEVTGTLVETLDGAAWLSDLPEVDPQKAKLGRALALAGPSAAALATLTRYDTGSQYTLLVVDAFSRLGSLVYRDAGDTARLLALRSVPFTALCALADNGRYKELVELATTKLRIGHWTEREMRLSNQLATAGYVRAADVQGLAPDPFGGFEAMKLAVQKLPRGHLKHGLEGLYLAEFLVCLSYLHANEGNRLWPTNFLFDSASIPVLRGFLQDISFDHNDLLPNFRTLLERYDTAITEVFGNLMLARAFQGGAGGFYRDATTYYNATHADPAPAEAQSSLKLS